MIRLVVLSRNRPDFLKETIHSFLDQNIDKKKFNIVVSDNSTNNDVSSMMQYFLPNRQIEYIRRDPPVSSHQHFLTVLEETKEDYLVIFHDDDVLHPDYLEKMHYAIKKIDGVAIGCNAYIFKNKILDAKKKPHGFSSSKIFNNNQEFLEQYLPGGPWIAPYSSYMYKTAALKKIKFKDSSKSGIGSDVLMINDLINLGDVIWIPEYLMYYRLHENNDSNNVYMSWKIALINKMAKSGLDKYSTRVRMLRAGYWLKWLIRENYKNHLRWKNRIVLKFVLLSFFYLIFQKLFWRSFFNKHTLRYLFK